MADEKGTDMTEILKLQAEQEPEREEDSPVSTISTGCCGNEVENG